MQPEGPYTLTVCDIPPHVIFFGPLLLRRGHDSSIGIETGYDSNTDNLLYPPQRSGRLSGQPNLVSNGYGGDNSQGVKLTAGLHLVEVRNGGAIPPLPHMPSRHNRHNFTFTFLILSSYLRRHLLNSLLRSIPTTFYTFLRHLMHVTFYHI
jgi:hypothetical protein